VAVPDEHTAKELLEKHAQQSATTPKGPTLEELMTRIRAGEAQELNLIIKTDVQGSVEAIQSALQQLSTDKAKIKILHAASGSIVESDVLLAAASNAIIVGFNSRPEPGARRTAETTHVDIRYYDIIYKLVEDLQQALEGRLKPTTRDVVEGKAEVRAIFPFGKGNKAAGCFVLEGRILRNAMARVLRNGKLIFDGPISSLKRFKEDAREVAQGFECGVALANFSDFQEGDILEIHRHQPSSHPA